MCNFSQGFYERGFKEGFREGFKEGFREGFKKGFREGYRQSQIKSLKAVMEKLKLSFAEACDLLDIPEAEREEYYARITNENNPADSDR